MNNNLKFSLKPYHSFGLSVSASAYTAIDSEETLQELLPLKKPFLILGGGSNMLFTKDVDALVLHNQILGIEIIKETENAIFIRVGGGVVWHELVLWCIEQNFGGIENLSLIPGSVGAAPIQNIGAYGVELKDVLHYLEAINLQTGQRHSFTNEACEFGYRDSIFKRTLKNKYLISRVILKLSKKPILNLSYGAIQQVLEDSGETASIQSISKAIIKIRTEKLPDPKQIGNAGSFFKNPVISQAEYLRLQALFPNISHYPVDENNTKLAAGWLIDQLGWKGYRKGDAGVHKNQALVLVNYGNAKGSEIKALAEEIQDSVLARYGVELEMEVNVIG